MEDSLLNLTLSNLDLGHTMTHTPILHWATNCLTSNGYTLQSHPEIIQETPWSSVFRLSTNRGNVYLKQNPPTLSLEPQIMQLLRHQLHASVPFVIASSDELYCFLTQDAGQTLRQFLKIHFEPNLLSEAIRLFTTIQRSAENDIDSFLSLGVPDWRLNHLPKLYDQLLEQKDFLIADGMTSDEIKILRNLSSTISAQCDLLSQCQIPETIYKAQCLSDVWNRTL